MTIVLLPVMPALALDACRDAGLQQYGIKRLQQIVISTRLDTGNDLIHVLATTDHNDGRGAQTVVLFHALQHLCATNTRHH